MSGKGVSVYQYSFSCRYLQLHHRGVSTITIHHIMRRNLLPGVSDGGGCLERFERRYTALRVVFSGLTIFLAIAFAAS